MVNDVQVKKENPIQEKSFLFALEIIELYKFLISKNEYTLSKQLLRSGTSIGANVEEAIGAYSKKEFASKMGISLKEARESKCWLRLLDKSQFVQFDYSKQIKLADEQISILSAIVKSTKFALNNN